MLLPPNTHAYTCRRARIYRDLMPPDQYNPTGIITGEVTAFMPTKGRASKLKGREGGGVLAFDPRAIFLPFPDLPPGDPSRYV